MSFRQGGHRLHPRSPAGPSLLTRSLAKKMDCRVISAFTRVHSPRRRASTPLRTRYARQWRRGLCRYRRKILGRHRGLCVVSLAFAVDQKGILPDHMIAALARDGAIPRAYDFVPDQIQPASLDLRLGEV